MSPAAARTSMPGWRARSSAAVASSASTPRAVTTTFTPSAASAAAQTGMVGPMSTLLMGVLILGEPFTAWIAAGTVLVLVGIWLLARWR